MISHCSQRLLRYEWKKLTDTEDTMIAQGAIFRFPVKWPYEELVDLMVLSLPEEGSKHALVVISGNKAGRLLVRLPLEAELEGPIAMSKQWVIDNWAKWIYPDRDVTAAMYLRRYDIPAFPPLASATRLP